MIEVKNLTKIYAQNKRQQCVALNDVSFTLPDKGMVFIVGKSGCGKSTLLNVLGGLDKLTSGDIFVDGNAFSKFSETDFTAYRNGYLGFIFQDFCLLDELTVRQNIALSLQLCGDENANKVDTMLQLVELDAYADRYPDELSGGQKQRVAIARAIIKSPKVILADEPTGNLDSKTSHQILSQLKQLAESRLVVVVSHNMQDANDFADRIIEISDGKIIGDVERNPSASDVSISDSETVFQQGTVFTSEQLQQINAKINSNQQNYTLKQVSDKFVAAKNVQANIATHTTMQPVKGISGKYAKQLFVTFTKKRIISLVLTVLLVISLIIILGVCQLFTKFDADREVGKLLRENDGAFIMQKGYVSQDIYHTLKTDRLTRITDEDIQAFYDSGYKGNIYPLYNTPLIVNDSVLYNLESFNPLDEIGNYSGFYSKHGLGVLYCNRQYLESVYSDENGELDVLSGEIDDDSMGIIITDYFADSILFFADRYRTFGVDPYANITTAGSICDRYKVGAVINTGYKERYAELIRAYLEGDPLKDESVAQLYSDFISELNASLNVAYTFNGQYLERILAHQAGYKGFSHLTNPTWTTSSGKSATFVNHCYWDASGLITNDDQIIVSKEIYNQITGEGVAEDDYEYWNNVIGTNLTITNYDTTQTDGEPLFVWEMKIVGLLNGHGVGFRVSANRLLQAKQYESFAYKLYFDNSNGIVSVYDVGEQRNFVVQSPLFSAVYMVAKAVDVFVDFFMLIVVALYVICAVLLISFVMGGIRKNIYEIGVLRALGARTRDLAFVFAMQMLIVGVAVSVISMLGLGLGCGVVNNILVDGFVKFAKNPLIRDISIISFSWTTAIINVALVIGLTLFSSFAPFVLLRKIKPREIIRAKE